MANKVKHFLGQVKPRCLPSMAMHINYIHINSTAGVCMLWQHWCIHFMQDFITIQTCSQCILTLLTLCPLSLKVNCTQCAR